MTFVLEGDANDHLGKGLSGGRLVVFPPAGSSFVPEENIVIGNVGLYGATGGEAYIRGMAGERFAVRNSGADAVVEAVGDHGCEYMTGGHVVVLGPAGRNFGAGMSGGIAYVLDEVGDFADRVNKQMVGIESLTDSEEIGRVRNMIERHRELTGSARAAYVLDNWQAMLPKFARIIPKDFKRAVESLKRAHEQGLSGDEAIMVAFEENARDLARVGGN
jgi:glutamate synthase domain-containing protein 3